MEKQQETSTSSLPQNLTNRAGEDKGKWYVIHIQSGYEQKTKQALQQRIKSLGMEDKIFDVVIPMREIVAVKRGKKTKQKEKVFPGYILVKMILDDDSWLVVRTTEGVTGFVGAGLKPTPISDKEVEAIMRFVQQEQPKFKAKFSVGEAVKITEGPFADFLGTIEAIDEARGKVRVLVSIFDRETPVELDFLQVQKL
jgi:transcriptional antiterminator NusG